MSLSNRDRVGKGLELLRQGLLPFMELRLRKHLGDGWQEIAQQRFDLRKNPEGQVHWDTAALLKLFLQPEVWREMLEPVVSRSARSYAGELVDVRNRHAHDEAFTNDQTDRALDTIRLLLAEVGAVREAEQILESRMELQRAVYAEQARNKVRYKPLIEGAPAAGLKPWREIVTPHQDVISGRYVQAEFAADLHNVHHGIGGPEYTDPEEFYRRTFITEGIRELLLGALERLAGKGGDPVVELQTNFGGGKTHAMLALYHLFGSARTTSLPGLEPILAQLGMEKAPSAKRAVLVGTHLSVGEVSKKPDGTRVRTLWGEMAWQLGGAGGYAMVADSDAKGVSPGAKVLTDLFNRFGPCLVLIDEWVAYSRNTVDRRDLPSGDFEAQATFAQAITEAAKAADKTLVVASIPSSDIEVGGTNGKHALAVLKNVFERVGKTWRPASPEEGFEIVRRRLFQPVTGKEAFALRDAVVDAFARMYEQNKADFPPGTGEGAYKRKLEAAYPLHPDVFDQLYGEWSTLDKFQRTRGVLRLLAKVIHQLWESGDQGLLILPASIPMGDPAVKSELTRYLEDVWEPIISEDVDGPSALPNELDRANPNLGKFRACLRVARALYLGTAPGSAGKNPGVDDRRIRLGCAQPGENIPSFGDALRRISDRAKHIHQDGNRYWISTKPNLNRLADDRASSFLSRPEELHAEIVRRIREECKPKANRGDFAGVHPCPESSSEVHDEPEARLVILGPTFWHRKGQADSPGMKQARTLLDQRGNSPRLNRNTLVFLSADEARLNELMQGVAQFLAWKSVFEDQASLNLDEFQRRQAESRSKDSNDTVDARIKETWTLALIPIHKEPKPGVQVRPDELIGLDEIRVQGSEPLAKRTSTRLKAEGSLVPALGGVNLRNQLDKYLWKEKDHVSVGELSEWFPRYLYLSRLVNHDTLLGAIRDGLTQLLAQDTFVLAAGYDPETQRYQGLQARPSAPILESKTLLVKPSVAKQQQEREQEELERLRQEELRAAQQAAESRHQDGASGGLRVPPGVRIIEPTIITIGGPGGLTVTSPGHNHIAPTPARKPNVFVGSVRLDSTRVGRDAGRINEEVIQHLATLPKAEVEVRLEILVKVPGGVADDVMRTVSENSRTLKFETAGFEEE